MNRRVALALLLPGLVLASPSCSDETIVLADVPVVDGGSSRDERTSRRRCLSSADCAEGTFCDRRHCDDPAGTCDPFPVSCGGEEEPVCGCDGVTYWNECLRHAAGVSGSSPGECSSALTPCDEPGHECPTGATCARLGGLDGPLACAPRMNGRCWVLPATCPPPTRPDRWNECAPPDRPALHCVDTCTAMRTGHAFARASECR